MKQYINTLHAGSVLHGKSYNYCIEKVLGQGSFGITYLASVKMQGALGSIDAKIKVAVKEFFMKEINGREGTTVTSGSKGGLFADYRKKFVREATNLSKLQHPNIIKVLERFEANNTVYYTMEYLDGGSLDELITKKHGLSETETVKYTMQIANALSYMHEHKMLHLDLKPGNIMLSNGNAVLIDFGLSKQYDASGNPESSTTVGAGTPGYAPIEQSCYRDGNGFPVTMDVYALGATMYKMLRGQRPPNASEVLNDGLPDKPAFVSSEIWAAVEAAMEPIHKNRPQTVDAWVKMLEGGGSSNQSTRQQGEDTVRRSADEHKVSPTPRPSPPPHPWYYSTKKVLAVVTAVMAMVILLMLGLHDKGILSSCSNSQTMIWEVDTAVTDTPVSDSADYEVMEDDAPQTINGHECVDLGLSVKWATCNVGASSASDYGGYYAWGETSTKSSYDWDNCFDCLDSRGNSWGIYKVGGQTRITPTSGHDTARENWGGTWRMPTVAECDELCKKCQWTWTSQGGHNGYLITGPKGNSIFLPAAGLRDGTDTYHVGELGFYWFSALSSLGSNDAGYLGFDSSNHLTNIVYRRNGQSVRPVTD